MSRVLGDNLERERERERESTTYNFEVFSPKLEWQQSDGKEAALKGAIYLAEVTYRHAVVVIQLSKRQEADMIKWIVPGNVKR